MLTLEGEIRNITTRILKERTDEFTGAITPRETVYAVQIEYTEPQQEGDAKIVLRDFNLKIDKGLDAYVEAFRKLKGRIVKIPLALWNIDGKAGLAIPRGSLPIVVSQPLPKAV